MALPAYHEIDQLAPPSAPSNHSSSQLAEPDDPTDAEFSLIGGSGVRVPLLPDERGNYDRRVISHLRKYGVIERHNMDYPPNSPLRISAHFQPDAFYQSIITQLDVLLPALLPLSRVLPPETSRRSITLRVELPDPDKMWVQADRVSGKVHGREVLSAAFVTWFNSQFSRNAELALYDAVDAVTGRVTLEGVLIVQENWDLRRGLWILTVRC
ncbi:hypothetical protein BDV93DRAFT_528402 [Ceratobasidium sp. AG-I]|nr:hypothetical protein BDV93DRAFT_528402 [Ceratobasidium sp. AG-I]